MCAFRFLAIARICHLLCHAMSIDITISCHLYEPENFLYVICYVLQWHSI